MICASASGAPKVVIESGQLPLCEDTLNHHTRRANYLQYEDEALRPSRLFLPQRMAMDGEGHKVVDSASVG